MFFTVFAALAGLSAPGAGSEASDAPDGKAAGNAGFSALAFQRGYFPRAAGGKCRCQQPGGTAVLQGYTAHVTHGVFASVPDAGGGGAFAGNS